MASDDEVVVDGPHDSSGLDWHREGRAVHDVGTSPQRLTPKANRIPTELVPERPPAPPYRRPIPQRDQLVAAARALVGHGRMEGQNEALPTSRSSTTGRADVEPHPQLVAGYCLYSSGCAVRHRPPDATWDGATEGPNLYQRLVLDVSPLQIDSSSSRGIGTFVRGLVSGFDRIGHPYQTWGLRGRDGLDRAPDHNVGIFGSRATSRRLQLQAWGGPSLPADSLPHFNSPDVSGVEKRLRVPYVATLFDVIPLLYPDVYLPTARARANYASYVDHLQGAAAWFAISNAAADDACTRLEYPRERVLVGHLGISEFPRAEPVKGLHGPFVLIGGTSEPHKNAAFGLDVVQAYRTQAATDVEAVMTGAPGPDRRRIEEHARRTAVPYRHLGHVSRGQLRWLYQEALAVLLPSSYEGFGLQAVEAMSCGGLVVTSDCAAFEEVASPGACVVPLDVDSWIYAIQGLHEDEDAVRDRGLEHARSFSWVRTAMAAAELYRQLGLEIDDPALRTDDT